MDPGETLVSLVWREIFKTRHMNLRLGVEPRESMKVREPKNKNLSKEREFHYQGKILLFFWRKKIPRFALNEKKLRERDFTESREVNVAFW